MKGTSTREGSGALDVRSLTGPWPEKVLLEPYGTGHGLMVRAEAPIGLGQLAPQSVVALLREAGFVLFWGFAADLDEFSRFVERHSDRITLDPARAFHGGTVAQKVDAGSGAISLHCENGNSPFAPDLTWFFSQKAARRGSQTTVCDGIRVWKDLSDEARTAFSNQDIVYTRRVQEQAWRAFVSFHLGGIVPPSEITQAHLQRVLGSVNETTTIDRNADGSITYSFRTRAAHPTLFSETMAFANSLLGPSYNYEAPTITFGDGTNIPAHLIDEVSQVTSRLTENVEWQDGGIALLDNTRVMHGRRAIEDPDRTIFNVQSYIAKELL